MYSAAADSASVPATRLPMSPASASTWANARSPSNSAGAAGVAAVPVAVSVTVAVAEGVVAGLEEGDGVGVGLAFDGAAVGVASDLQAIVRITETAKRTTKGRRHEAANGGAPHVLFAYGTSAKG